MTYTQEAHCLVCGFAPVALLEITLWQRLIGLRDRLRIGFVGLVAREIEDSIPRSWHTYTYLIDESPELRHIVQPDQPKRAFAAVVDGNMAELVMIGPPTEEAWERFEALLAERFG